MLAALKRVQYYEIKAYSGHFYTQKAGKQHFVAQRQGLVCWKSAILQAAPTRFLKDMRTFVLFQ